MAERVFIGSDGGRFLIRASKPGHEARSAALPDLNLHEDMEPLVPWEQGVVGVGAGGSAAVQLQRAYALPPFVVIRCSHNYVPSPQSFFARFDANNRVLTVYNRVGHDLTVKYCVFGEV